MAETIAFRPTGVSEVTQAIAMAEATARKARLAAARAAEARSKAEEAARRVAAMREKSSGAVPVAKPLAEALGSGPVAKAIAQGPILPAGLAADAADAPREVLPTLPIRKNRIADIKRNSVGKRAEEFAGMPSGVIRVASNLRSQRTERDRQRTEIRRTVPAREMGAMLDPVAHEAGLHVPAKRVKRPLMTPRLAFLIALLVVFTLYATGNIPQLDLWMNGIIDATQAHNDTVVSMIYGHWSSILYGICVVLAAMIGFGLFQNHRKQQLTSIA
ncbi:hypothetical protein ACFQBQ_00430 [Granulicella cerasi]|uniref:Uncharacterized protein n=1 Tax=Granulicella cerasi TaxID=741063 RepID=A0ABW1Z504_9BACT|nr:hypothetical protein [Granulicella cerasi]